MAELQIGGKTLVTQTGTDNPVLGSTVNVDSALTGATFPAGHIIQIVQGTDNAYNSYSIGANSTIDWITKTIIRKKTNSKIQIIFSGHYSANANSDDAVRIDRIHNSTTTSLGTGSDTSRSYLNIWSPGTDRGYMQTVGSGTYSTAPVSFSYLDTPTDSVLDITYTVKIWSESAKTIYPNGDGWRGSGIQTHNTMAKLILMEISA